MKKYFVLLLLMIYGFNFSLLSQEIVVKSNDEFQNHIKTTINELIESSPKEDSIIIIDDMLFLKDQLIQKGSFDGTRWPYGKVYYAFNSNVNETNKQQFLNAAQNWEDCAGITFIERTSEPNFIEVKDTLFNSSWVGMVGGKQILNIYNWDWEFIIAHEIAHALGAVHEHQRSDRDNFVTIIESNIKAGKEHNFKKIISSDNYTDYDFESVMHYPKGAFSITPGTNTIEPRAGYEQFLDTMGQRTHLTANDMTAMAIRYQSPEVALVIDRSGSMNGSYITAAKTASKNFVDLMHINDFLAVTSFSSSASVNFLFTKISSEQIKANAKNAINSINASGGTSIGAGIQKAQQQLNLGNTEKTQGMILLSDGYENVAPYVSQVLPTIPGNTDIYTIALGPDSDQTLLNNVASATGGFYSYSPGTTRLALIYNSIRAKVTGQQVLAWIIGVIVQGQNLFHDVFVDGGASLVNFSLTWPGSDLDLVLIDPNGTLIDHNTTDPNISFSSGGTFENYAVMNPVPGEYTLKITGVSVTGQEEYNIIVTGESSLKMGVDFNKSVYGINEPILVTADIKDGNLPVTGATVTTEVTTPSKNSNIPKVTNPDREPESGTSLNYDNSTGNYLDDSGKVFYYRSDLILFDDGLHGDGLANDGVYGNYFTNTSALGSYSFDVSASGIAPVSGNFARVQSKSTTVTNTQSLVVTKPQTGTNWNSNSYHTVQWSSTNITGNVDIYLSIDGGSSYNIPLVLNTPDDGFQDVLIPNVSSVTCRIKLQSIDNPAVSGVNPGNFIILENSNAQEINLPQGWSLISSYQSPDIPQLETIFADLITNSTMEIMLGKSGIFWPGYNINTLGDWNSYEAYKLKMNESDQVIITGELLQNKTVELPAGISYMPMLSVAPVNAEEIFDQIEGKLNFAFEVTAGLTYWPAGGIYTLEVLEPGKGYLVGMLETASVTFPDAGGKSTTKQNRAQIIDNAPWQVTNTGIPHLISIQTSALEKLVKDDIIAVFNSEDRCVGMTLVVGGTQNLALVIYGDDVTTEAVDGMMNNELMRFVIYIPESSHSVNIEPRYSQSMTHTNRFAENGLSAITGWKNATAIDENLLNLVSIYPNPNTGIFHVDGISGKVEIQILNSTGQLVRMFSTEQSTTIDLSGHAKGIYYIRMISQQSTSIQKIVVK